MSERSGAVAALIPAHNEEHSIAEVVRRTKAIVGRVLVVDDGSSDGTAKAAAEAGADVLPLQPNRGKGAALIAGLRQLLESDVKEMVLLDADLQHVPEEISRFLESGAAGEYSLLLGERALDQEAMPVVRLLTNRLMSALISVLCGQRVPDSQCGFRWIRADAARVFVSDCRCERFDFETEMLFVASVHGLRIGAVPISTVYGEEQSKIRPFVDTARFVRLVARFLRSRRSKQVQGGQV